MVSYLSLVFLMLAHLSTLNGDEVVAFSNDEKVAASLDNTNFFENQPLTGTIMITHDSRHVVDMKSFLVGKESLKAELLKEVQFGSYSSLILSIYSFSLPGKSPGLYALPPISVLVGGKRFQSIMITYTVQPGQGSAPGAPPVPAEPPDNASSGNNGAMSSTANPQLRLEATIDGKSSLYPGQRTNMVYRYYYSGHIALTKEVLPLLDAQGLIKIGEKVFKDLTQGDLSVTQISQEVEAVKPGDFSFGPSTIEGYAYKDEGEGKQVHTSPKLASTAPPVVLTVLPFPQKNQPPSFNGAVGKFSFTASLKSSPELHVGDRIELLLTVSGEGNFNTVKAPDIARQPGFGGLFQVDDLPSNEDAHGDSKNIVISLHPLTADIKEIPSIAFSFFDPSNTVYTTLKSPPLPINIKSDFSEPSKAIPVAGQPNNQSNESNETKSTPATPTNEVKIIPPAPIEIEGILSLGASDLFNKLGGTWWSLALLPLGLALFVFQKHLLAYMAEHPLKAEQLNSRKALQLALSKPEGSSEYFDGISAALKLSLVEAGLISNVEIADENLPVKDLAGDVRAFLCDIEEKRFASKMDGGKEIIDYASVRAIANDLLNSVNK